jgi:hypothetical protein
MYKIINDLPIDYDFNSKSKDELKLYKIWFENNKKKRLDHIIEYVKSSSIFEDWKADFTPHSLMKLGEWVEQNIEIEKISEKEYEKKRNITPTWIELQDWDLSIKTRSILVDVSIYFGEVFLNIHKELHWEQYFSKVKKDIDNGHMIISFKKVNLNPVWLLYIMGLKLANQQENKSCLYNLYKAWEKYI